MHNNEMQLTKRAVQRGRVLQLISVFCGRGIKWMSKLAEEGARVFRVVRE